MCRCSYEGCGLSFSGRKELKRHHKTHAGTLQSSHNMQYMYTYYAVVGHLTIQPIHMPWWYGCKVMGCLQALELFWAALGVCCGTAGITQAPLCYRWELVLELVSYREGGRDLVVLSCHTVRGSFTITACTGTLAGFLFHTSFTCCGAAASNQLV